MVRAMKDRKLLKPSHSLRFLRAVIPYRLGLISSYRAMEIIVGMYRGATLEETLDHNTVLFNDYLKNDIRPDAVRELEMHRSRGGKTVLLSASTDFVCSRIAEYLEMDGVLCTELEVIDGVLTGKLSRRYCHGEEKLIRAEEYCRENGYSLENAWYYGDAWADRFILGAVGNPRCVTPSPRLQREAEKLSWEILNWST